METFCNIISKTILFFVYPIAFIASFFYHLVKMIFTSSND